MAHTHGNEYQRRLGYPTQVMIGTLNWLLQTAGPSEAGFFAPHPATADRIDRLRQAVG